MNTRVVLGTLASIVLLTASHWFFLENVHHRIWGVAWGGLFQIFGNLLAGTASIWIGALAFFKRVSPSIGIMAALSLGLTAGYCFLHSFGLMMSI
jgi:hypothetical protein